MLFNCSSLPFILTLSTCPIHSSLLCIFFWWMFLLNSSSSYIQIALERCSPFVLTIYSCSQILLPISHLIYDISSCASSYKKTPLHFLLHSAPATLNHVTLKGLLYFLTSLLLHSYFKPIIILTYSLKLWLLPLPFHHLNKWMSYGSWISLLPQALLYSVPLQLGPVSFNATSHHFISQFTFKFLFQTLKH